MAFEEYIQSHDSEVKKCGLLFNPDFPYLRADPDGLCFSIGWMNPNAIIKRR